MSSSDEPLIARLSVRHSVSPDAVRTILRALRSSGGSMAQFSHADFGGMSQWSPGMAMVGDMFNDALKTKLGAICSDLAAHLSETSSSQQAQPSADVSYRSEPARSDWWPADLGKPGAVGSQNDLRYAVFPDTRRLAIDDNGRTEIYDTADHRIFGVAQAQSSDRTLTFTSQHGLVRISDLGKLAPS